MYNIVSLAQLDIVVAIAFFSSAFITFVSICPVFKCTPIFMELDFNGPCLSSQRQLSVLLFFVQKRLTGEICYEVS